MRDVWFWQRIVSPHMAGLAWAMARNGCRVTYVAEEELNEHRRQMGWILPALDGVNLRFVRNQKNINTCIADAGTSAIHLCQGLRGNGYVAAVQKRLAKRGLQYWVLMETVDDAGWRGVVKREVYSALFHRWRRPIAGVLATGQRTATWVAERGMPQVKIFPFTYFLADGRVPVGHCPRLDAPFQIAFVGQFIERKRLPMLVDALAVLGGSAELVVAGSGPLENAWRAYAERRLPGRIRWIGKLPSHKAQELMANVDCLVLPSRHDGWGAVVTEALMSGTPAICSDRCGAAEAVLASGVGGIFVAGDVAGLTLLLGQAIAAGKLSPSNRKKLSQWGSSFGADAGARYFLEILANVEGIGPRPVAPWLRGNALV